MHLEAVARQTGFLRRKTKLTPSVFLDTLLFNEFDNKQVSLNDHSLDLRLKHQLQIRKQSLDQRFNACSVDFVKALLTEQMSLQLNRSIHSSVLDPFSSVKIKDSTRFWLPANLKEVYPGNGGSDCQAGMHIQFEFDLKSGQIIDINPTSALRQDQTDAVETIESITPGSLVIRDLGYFSTVVLEQINNRHAYFITRLSPRVHVFELRQGQYQLLDINSIYKKMKQRQIAQMELCVFVGSERKIPVRLFLETLPDEQISQRLRKANRQAAKKGGKPSGKYTVYRKINLFITNVQAERLATQHIRTLYRLRWQIEIRFKCWKSLWHLDSVKKMKQHRFQTYLYASLLHIIINWEIAVNLTSIVWNNTGKLLSIYKCFKALKQSRQWLREVLFLRGKNTFLFVKLLIDSAVNLLLEKRNNRLCQQEILQLNLQTKLRPC